MHLNATGHDRPKTEAAARGELRTKLQAMWSAVAPAWGANAGYIEARGRPVSEELVERVDPRPGERVLELACGTVPAGLPAAPLVEPGGELVIFRLLGRVVQSGSVVM